MSERSGPEPIQSATIRRGLAVRGVVQGVGFRPFIYRIAHEERLAGSIGNDTEGVTIEVEGAPDRVEEFVRRVRADAPPLARIDSISLRALSATGETGFLILASEVLGRVSTGIPADAATCADCLRELLDPGDRRFGYPFLNCTNCGPRFTITRSIPYDRPQTSMAKFTMCAACQAEYDDPANRRFHAQPNACWECGPRVWLIEAGTQVAEKTEAVAACIDRLVHGEIVAVKGIGGFHLSVDAVNERAVLRLRGRKHRHGKPLAVMVRDLSVARELCALTAEEEKLLEQNARPIVIARKREANGIADSVAPGVPWLGVFLPYAPLQHLLFADRRIRALVMTSANLSEEPIAIDNNEAQVRLAGIADSFLFHDREILQRCDDSVVAAVDGAPQLLRRARGFVPLAVETPFDAPPLLAVGGHLKNVFALARGPHVYQSQHLGDLEDLMGMKFFEESLAHFKRTFEVEPQTVVHDLHPEYVSTRWARRQVARRGLKSIAVQHHHAHVAGCMAEHGLTEAIGLALDGTGYGTDGKIWGGEMLIARLDSFERFAHLEYVPMPGGEAAVKAPWCMAYGAMRSAGVDASRAMRLAGADSNQARILDQMMERRLNTPMTSSLGRLCDAVAAAVLHRRIVDYEAQAAIELEGIAVDEEDGPGYQLEISAGDEKTQGPLQIRTAAMWTQLLADLDARVSQSEISARFHAGVADAFARAAVAARAATGLTKVAMSGGCMHNRRLARLLRMKLENEGFEVFQHLHVSPGDGGLSYGQAVVAAAILSRKA